MLVDSETTRRINAACDGSDIEGSEEDLGFLRLVPVDVELAVGATPAVGPSEADEAAAWRGGMRFDTEGFLREISGLTEFERSRLRRDVISAALSHIALGTITFDCGDDQLIRTFAAEMDWRALAAEDTLIRQARIISD